MRRQREPGTLGGGLRPRRLPLRASMAALALVAAAGCAPRDTSEPRPEDGVAGRLIVTLEDTVSSSFRLVAAEVELDGTVLWICRDPEQSQSLDLREPVLVHDGLGAAGAHRLTTSLEYRGQGQGIFSYLGQYTFRVRGTHEFGIPAAGTLALRVTASEQGDVFTPLEERPQVRFEEQPFLLWAARSGASCPWTASRP
mgnify:CR=1 FL=1